MPSCFPCKQIALKNNKSGHTEICQRLTRSYLGFEPCSEPTVASKFVFIINNYVVINSYDLIMLLFSTFRIKCKITKKDSFEVYLENQMLIYSIQLFVISRMAAWQIKCADGQSADLTR